MTMKERKYHNFSDILKSRETVVVLRLVLLLLYFHFSYSTVYIKVIVRSFTKITVTFHDTDAVQYYHSASTKTSEVVSKRGSIFCQ